MAIAFLNNLNISDNQLQNAKLHVTSSAPSAEAGQIYYDSANDINTLKYYDGGGSTFRSIREIQVSNPTGTFVDLTAATANGLTTISAGLSATLPSESPANYVLDGSNTWVLKSAASNSYALNKAANSSNLIFSENGSTANTITFAGTANEISLDNSVVDTFTFGLPDAVTITDNLTVGGVIAQTGTVAGESNSFAAPLNMNNLKITSLADGTADNDAVNLGQLNTATAGMGVFKGGYDATNNSPVLTGGSNIALNTGDFYAVTTGGSFLGTTVEPGDFIFAATEIAANSTPSASDYTVVQSGQSIATAAADDNSTTKGIAGFDSSTFTVTSNGWVESKVFTGQQKGVVPNTSGNVDTVFLNGQGAFATPPNDNTEYTAGTGLTLSGTVFDANVDGTQTVAANTSSTTAARTYKVQVDASDNLVVNVPWDAAGGGDVTGVNASTATDKLGIDVASSTGPVPVVGLDIDGRTAFDSSTEDLDAAEDEFIFYDQSEGASGTNLKITAGNLAFELGKLKSSSQTIGNGSATTFSISYGFTASSTNNVMIQLVNSGGDTVYADVDRTGPTGADIIFSTAPATNSVTVLCHAIG